MQRLSFVRFDAEITVCYYKQLLIVRFDPAMRRLPLSGTGGLGTEHGIWGYNPVYKVTPTRGGAWAVERPSKHELLVRRLQLHYHC